MVTEHGTQQLRTVHSYKHLGSYVQDHAVVQKDVRHRISQARKSVWPAQSAVLQQEKCE